MAHQSSSVDLPVDRSQAVPILREWFNGLPDHAVLEAGRTVPVDDLEWPDGSFLIAELIARWEE